MRHTHWHVPFLTLTLALLASGGTSFALAQSSATTITLAPMAGSEVSGTATLTDLGEGKTRVDVGVAPTSGDYPAHIHEGTCANPNPAPKYPLANVQNGSSTSEVNVSLADLARAPMAINVHRSAQELATIAACGDLSVGGAAAQEAGGLEAGVDPNVTALPSGGEGNLVALAAGLLALGGFGLFIRRLGRRRR